MSEFKTIEWVKNKVVMIDQTRLPEEEVYREFSSYRDVADAIRNMVIRGAPAIGIAAAMGCALGALEFKGTGYGKFTEHFNKVCEILGKTRPTAVNLFWALSRMKEKVNASSDKSIKEIQQILIEEAKQILAQDVKMCIDIGDNGAELINDNSVILTHCNAGGLATGGYGTALGVIRSAVNMGKKIEVISSETRPFLQGSRLTAWELQKDNIPVTLITDNMVGHLMKNGKIDAVVVGADRVASNGDVANKIGTYSVSVLAKHHNIPFYVAAPTSTIDMECRSGKDIPIEQRSSEEVTHIAGKAIAADVEVLNPAFDITPNQNVDSLITEKGVYRSPYNESLKRIKG